MPEISRFNTPVSFNYNLNGNPIIDNPINYEIPINSAVQTSSDLSNDLAGIDLFLETEVKESELDDSKIFLSS